MLRKIVSGLLFCAALACPAAAGADSLLIRNAVIYDGSGGPAVKGDLRVRDGLIDAVGSLTPEPGEKVRDAGGLALAPGFIDPHSHHDIGLEQQPAPASVLAQGITTIVTGVDGMTELPVAELFARFEKHPAAVNLASFGPHNNYRSRVMGEDFRRIASSREVEEMKTLLKADMAAGALGLATGVEYEPALYSDTAELVALARVAADEGGRYTSHIRSEDTKFHEALEEIVTIAREAHIPVNISHMKLAMAALWGQAPLVVERLDRARAEGLEVTADMYPYDGWQTTMQVLLPERNLKDCRAYEYALSDIARPETIIITLYEPNLSYVGKTLAQIAAAENRDPVDVLMEMMQTTDAGGGREMIIGRNIGEADIRTFMRWPWSSISSDGGIDDRHPRGQGAFPRVLARYVREQGVLSLSEAIRKMTGLTARSLGLKDRGLLKKGLAADLVLFDPETIADHATFADPIRYSTGVAAVWVNGELVWQEDKETGARPGRILRRPDQSEKQPN